MRQLKSELIAFKLDERLKKACMAAASRDRVSLSEWIRWRLWAVLNAQTDMARKNGSRKSAS